LRKSLDLSPVYARFPPFRCPSSVALSPFPLAVAVAAAVAYLSMPWLLGVDDWLASYGTTEKIELDPISTEDGYGSFLPFTTVTERNFLT